MDTPSRRSAPEAQLLYEETPESVAERERHAQDRRLAAQAGPSPAAGPPSAIAAAWSARGAGAAHPPILGCLAPPPPHPWVDRVDRHAGQDIVQRSNNLELVGLSAERSWETLVPGPRARRRPHRARRRGRRRSRRRGVDRRPGPQRGRGTRAARCRSGADLVLNALRLAGLGPTVAALGEGIDLALANKESLVVGGELVMQLAEATGDARCCRSTPSTRRCTTCCGGPGGALDRIVITASGGPFRGRGRDALAEVTVAEALKHPTWAMGGKITIDSATLMNKGLEVMEAHHLFGTPYEQIDVVVHPQSIVHALVETCDGASSRTSASPTCASRSPTRCTIPT